ncbi:hypothetical protein EVAR_46473_1 [Eumeta japonica]|uniref:Uncharacterized protein n=1 Tax=Eumeta variegata TaxID=151549 RepID=A0A4C1XJF7_EUMVA|nr:hypothetical protein EVAR_46473_1 [Eumeta japonica]
MNSGVVGYPRETRRAHNCLPKIWQRKTLLIRSRPRPATTARPWYERDRGNYSPNRNPKLFHIPFIPIHLNIYIYTETIQNRETERGNNWRQQDPSGCLQLVRFESAGRKSVKDSPCDGRAEDSACLPLAYRAISL